MKRTLITLLVLAMASASYFYLTPAPQELEIYNYSKEKHGIKGAIDYFSRMRANVNTGEYEITDYYKALDAAREQAAHKSSPLNPIKWIELGPNNIGGRNRSIAINPSNPNIMYAGGVTGGLYKSVDAGVGWTRVPLLDENCVDEEVVTIGSIGIAPNGDVYVGTGEFSGGGGIDYPGNGIYKSTDGGATFCQVSSTKVAGQPNPNAAWGYVNKIAVDPTNADRVYAANGNGLQVSSDGGGSWSRANNTLPSQAYDIEISNDGQTIHAIIGLQYWRSTDGGATFSNNTGNAGFPTVSGGFSRFVIAINQVDNNKIYCIANTGSTGSVFKGVYRSVDAGDTWTEIGPGGSTSFDPAGEQGYYDLAIGAMPSATTEKIFVGGQLQVWSWSPTDNWRQVNFFGQRYIHPDHHVITFNPNNPNVLYMGTDGGIYRTTAAGSQYPTWQVLNKGFNTTQFYRIAVSEATGKPMGGTQDNGNPYIDFEGNSVQSALSLRGGDGMQCAISRFNPEVFFTTVIFADLERSLNQGEGFSTIFNNKIDSDQDNIPDDNAGFHSRLVLWEGVDDTLPTTEVFGRLLVDTSGVSVVYDTVVQDTYGINRLFLAVNGGIWMASDPVNAQSPNWYKVATGLPNRSAEAMAISKDGDHLYLGINPSGGGGEIWRVSGLRNAIFGYNDCIINADTTVTCNYDVTADSTITAVKIFDSANQDVTDIAVDPNDGAHVLWSLGRYAAANNLYEATNADTASNQIALNEADVHGSGMPSMPIYSCLIDGADGNVLYAGTELGFYASQNGGTTWSFENDSMNWVPVFDIVQIPHPFETASGGGDSLVLYIGTHGRGIFASGFDPSLYYPQNTVGIGDRNDSQQDLIKIWPNPMDQFGYVSVDMVSAGTVHIEVYDLSGRKAGELVESSQSGKQQFQLNTSDLKNGTYLIRVQAGKEIKVGKIVVLR
jgi:hypothetical protein